MKWFRVCESDESDKTYANFDYAKLKFPKPGSKTTIENSEKETYDLFNQEFCELNDAYLRSVGLLNSESDCFGFRFDVYAEGSWHGKYYPATRYEPEEYPEFEIDESYSELVSATNEDGFDLTELLPSEEQAIEDGNGQWYSEYKEFIKTIGEVAESDYCDRLSENPPEYDGGPDDYDGPDEWDDYDGPDEWDDYGY